MRARQLALFITTLAVAVSFAACDRKAATVASDEERAIATGAAPAPMARDLYQAGARQGKAAADAVDQVQVTRDSVAPSMIIRNGTATVQVDKLDDAVAALRALAQRMGGYVTNTSVTTGQDQVPAAMIELKIPATHFDSAMAGLSPLGKVESVNTTAEDVGEQFVDVTARLANARRLEERIQTILATRTGKLEDIIAAERELARIREEIERFEGRLRYLRTHVALSTLTVSVHEPYPVVGGPGTGPIAESFKHMWRNFVLFIASLIASLGWLVPLGAIGLVVWVGVRKYLRTRRTRTPTVEPSMQPAKS